MRPTSRLSTACTKPSASLQPQGLISLRIAILGSRTPQGVDGQLEVRKGRLDVMSWRVPTCRTKWRLAKGPASLSAQVSNLLLRLIDNVGTGPVAATRKRTGGKVIDATLLGLWTNQERQRK